MMVGLGGGLATVTLTDTLFIYSDISQSINQSKHSYIVPRVASESEAQDDMD